MKTPSIQSRYFSPKLLMTTTIVVVLLDWLNAFCSAQDCKILPSSFPSYEVALKKVKAATFKVKETVDTSQSSWIIGAAFYSCDSRVGFLIIKTDDREYIHQGVPIEIWMAFKAASSMGSYYQANIRNRYKLKLND